MVDVGESKVVPRVHKKRIPCFYTEGSVSGTEATFREIPGAFDAISGQKLHDHLDLWMVNSPSAEERLRIFG